MKKFLQSEWGILIRIIAGFLLIVAVVLCVVFTLQSIGLAEEEETPCWVLCMPESYVTVRTGPSKKASEFGGAPCGNGMYTDGKVRNGFLHVTELAAEESTGWIHTGYIVYDEPVQVNAEMTVRSNGRVAVRKSVNGKITAWAHDGDRIFVYWAGGGWAVTEKGYMKSDFLQAGDEE